MKLWWASALCVLICSACDDGDVGRCCEVVGSASEDLIPVPVVTDGMVINNIAQDPAFNCASLTCVTTAGSRAYCTSPCEVDEDCPGGFICQAALTSEPLPDAPIQPEDRFCVFAQVGTSTAPPACF
ncbi:MAG: hypothetical protein ACFB9M_11600 [Myxococcota bacterium]